jgi:hypothetical protein
MSRNSTSAIYKSTYYLGIVYVKLATNQKLCGVSTYLPIPEVLCLECIWNTRSATMISSPRLRPSGGQKYIPMIHPWRGQYSCRCTFPFTTELLS